MSNTYFNYKKMKNRRFNKSYRSTNTSSYTNLESFTRTFLDPRKKVTLRYVQTLQFSIEAGDATSHIWRLNSIFDPDLTNGSGEHQPYGFDQLATFYARYRVMKTIVRAVFSPSSLTYGIVVIPSNGNLANAITNQATFQNACESPRAKHWFQGASGVSRQITVAIALNDLNGTSLQEYMTSDRTQALNNTNPTEVLELIIGLFNPDASNTIVINMDVEFRFLTEIWDPIIQAGS
jgi:hypothetical protein